MNSGKVVYRPRRRDWFCGVQAISIAIGTGVASIAGRIRRRGDKERLGRSGSRRFAGQGWSVEEEQQILVALQGLQQDSPERIMNGVRILELANKAYFLYLKQPPAEKAKLLRIVLSNCSVDATSFPFLTESLST